MAERRARLKYHCVEILGGSPCCDAARGLAGQRLLSDKAPLLPLADCSQPADCTCTYQHHDDRRAGPRRQATVVRTHGRSVWHGPDRRLGRGRRESDSD